MYDLLKPARLTQYKVVFIGDKNTCSCRTCLRRSSWIWTRC